jgi:hypothetical protein
MGNVLVRGIFADGKLIGSSYIVEDSADIQNAFECAVVIDGYKAEDGFQVNYKEVQFFDKNEGK